MSVIGHPRAVADRCSGLAGGGLVLNLYPDGDTCVVHARGELDLTSRDQLFIAATAGNHAAILIDLAEVTFMDCSGYGSLLASRLVIERQGRALDIRGHTGQPARLLELVRTLETDDPPGSSSRC